MDKTKVEIDRQNQFDVREVSQIKTVNLTRKNVWTLKDHTKPKDIIISLGSGSGSLDHSVLLNRFVGEQHGIDNIAGLRDLINELTTMIENKVSPNDLAAVAFSGEMGDLVTTLPAIIYCGTATEVI